MPWVRGVIVLAAPAVIPTRTGCFDPYRGGVICPPGAVRLIATKAYRATIDFCLAARSLEAAAELEERLIEAAEELGVFFQYASTGEMKREEIDPGSPLAHTLFGR